MLFFGILKLTIRRGQINFSIVFIFVTCEVNGYHHVPIGQLNFDCACTAGAAPVCKAKLGISWSMAPMLCYVTVVVGRTRPRSMLLAMLTMKTRVSWVSISMHACCIVPIVMVLRLAACEAAGSFLYWYYTCRF